MAQTNLDDALRSDGAAWGDFFGSQAVLHFGDAEAEFAALTAGAGLVDRSARTRIEMSGADRTSFLHNLSSNEIKKLSVGQGCEAFLLNVKGHVLGHVFVFCRPESLLLESAPQQAGKLLAHLDRYLIREKVELNDLGSSSGEFLLSGPASRDMLAKLTPDPPPEQRLALVETEFAGTNVTIARAGLLGIDGYLLFFPADRRSELWRTLRAAGASACGQLAADAARIEAGLPEYGRDIHEENLPQEVARDRLAISFNKGCYLGQETVARLDALGHVNKSLVRITIAGDHPPAPGSELRAEGKTAGHITSAAFSPRLSATVALAYVRRGLNVTGTVLESTVGPATVA